MMADEWMNVLISVMIITGVVLIRELFYSLKRAETDRARSERRLLNAIINTEETEKKRFAKDLHDGLGPAAVNGEDVALGPEHQGLPTRWE
ncbi:MAG: hypothetical protein MZV63_50495 [Marinilabiliales bacterium]|nr:hypothetical protein [Marinilabiliales bacterium]